MHLFYVDESYDNANFVMTAVGLKVEAWRGVIDSLQAFRRELRAQFGIKVTREIHASRFVRDCSDRIAVHKLNYGHRKHAFELCLRHLASLESVRLINVCLPIGTAHHNVIHVWAIERLMNRINRTMKEKKSHAMVIFDEGKAHEIERLSRRMAVFNPIPSKYGQWAGGGQTKNIVLDLVIEDPIFKRSHRSLILQCADHAAYALLKRESVPTKFVRTWGYHRLFPILKPVLFLPAAPKDPDGIVR